jgi:hypothetical protein
MAIKLDMGRAWNDAVAMLSANRQVVAVVAGVFFLLPNVAMSLFAPQAPAAATPPPGVQPDPDQVMAQVSAELGAWFQDVWWMFLLVGLVQAIGTIGLLALLTDRSRPTVGEALGFGLRALPTYIATQLIIVFGYLAFAVVLLLLASASPVAAAIVGLILIVGLVYAMIKLVLVTPVIGIEREMNPLAALKRSWRLTKGNSLRIFGFILLLLVAFLVISVVASMVFMAASLLGDEVGLIVTAVGNGVLTMALVAVMVAALAAIHRQLSGAVPGGATAVFD